ncbi:MAG: hypothetical protein WC328_00610 [Kiritimatiellia bacterium]|jgi:hypothetical protein|nr:hypothetical protein [Kiritimatiellia bacterium]MDD4173497.1 hypothetical protein [Kiritimatiellia bacterium]MDD4441569.1 hypothetical protein [Kiritimatiellia bacterium]MDX9792682.1 hypothetical protein [Kiritimatiellia bacterium]NLC81575.1 hypothetical protein [Lentisphaerota bacterium]
MKNKDDLKSAIIDKTAAESAYGFMRQLDRVFLWLLLKAEPGSTVSFELIDDVGVTNTDGCVLAEQNKSFVAKASNPLRNRSEALWKTLLNWIEECIAGRLNVHNTQFLLWLSAPCTPGTWAISLFEADSSEKVDAFITLVKKTSLKMAIKTRQIMFMRLSAKSLGTMIRTEPSFTPSSCVL